MSKIRLGVNEAGLNISETRNYARMKQKCDPREFVDRQERSRIRVRDCFELSTFSLESCLLAEALAQAGALSILEIPHCVGDCRLMTFEDVTPVFLFDIQPHFSYIRVR